MASRLIHFATFILVMTETANAQSGAEPNAESLSPAPTTSPIQDDATKKDSIIEDEPSPSPQPAVGLLPKKEDEQPSQQSKVPEKGTRKSVQMNANKRKISPVSFEYNFVLDHSDNGFKENEAKGERTEFESQAFVRFAKGVGNDTLFESKLNILSESSEIVDAVEFARIRRDISSLFSVVAGRDYLMVGGFENKISAVDEVSMSTYNESRLPFFDISETRSATALTLELRGGAAGTFALQITDDVVAVPSEQSGASEDESWNYFNSHRRQPAALLEWSGSYWGLTPMLQVASYDINHSLYTAIGLKLDLGRVRGYADFAQDNRAYRDGAESKSVRYTNIVTNVEVDLGPLSLYGKFTQFRAEQPDIDGVGNSSADSFDDNSSSISGGIEARAYGESFVPHLSYLKRSQNVGDNPRDPFSAVESEERSIVLGVRGRL